MAYHGSSHNSPADPDIKKAMMGGHSQSVKANYSQNVAQGDKFNSDGGMKVIKDAGMGHSYGSMRVASSPMMKNPKKSWRSSGSRSRYNRSESTGSTGGSHA
jgi:hypothetical protein